MNDVTWISIDDSLPEPDPDKEYLVLYTGEWANGMFERMEIARYWQISALGFIKRGGFQKVMEGVTHWWPVDRLEK